MSNIKKARKMAADVMSNDARGEESGKGAKFIDKKSREGDGAEHLKSVFNNNLKNISLMSAEQKLAEMADRNLKFRGRFR